MATVKAALKHPFSMGWRERGCGVISREGTHHLAGIDQGKTFRGIANFYWGFARRFISASRIAFLVLP
jgi:hypothetical protein